MMDRLIEGYRRFRADTWPAQRSRYATLARDGQNPDTLVIGCSDSRADPYAVFDARPGELFVVRNVAALIPPYQPDAYYHGTSAAIEYAVRVLKVARIVVMSHGQCGGIRAMVEGAPEEAREFVKPWVDMAEPIVRSVPPHLKGGDIYSHCETEVMRLSLANLMTFPWIDQAVAEGRLKTQGFRFDIHNGILSRLEGSGLVVVE
jgi:carbonic anhydrase